MYNVRIPTTDPEDLDGQKKVSWDTPFQKLGDYAQMELQNLYKLTKAGCTCTPKLIEFMIESQDEDDCVPDGFKLYILMEKVPGRNLLNFDKFPIEERDQVRIAFAKAI